MSTASTGFCPPSHHDDLPVSGHSFDLDIQHWYGWLWRRQYEMAPEYAAFKASLFATIDPRFRAYFSADRNASVRLDEVRWGGVLQDGIPPLRSPTMIAAAEAHYLDDEIGRAHV